MVRHDTRHKEYLLSEALLDMIERTNTRLLKASGLANAEVSEKERELKLAIQELAVGC